MIDFESVLIGVGMLLIFVVPFIYVQYKHKYTEKKSQAELMKKAEEHHLNLGLHDVWAGKYGIGLDDDKGLLLYCNRTEGGQPGLLINIKELASCKKSTLKKADDSTKSISLVLRYKKDQSREDRLEFFDLKKNSNLFKILPLADKWEKLIISRIK